MSRCEEAGVGLGALPFFSTIVQSWGLADLVAPCVAVHAKEGEVALVVAVEVVPEGGLFEEAGALVRVLAVFSIFPVAVSR